MEKLILVLVVAAVLTYVHAQCPFFPCTNDIFHPRPDLNEDFNQCVQNIERAKTCVFNELKQDNICQLCQTWDFDGYANPVWIEKQGKNACLRKHCSLRDTMGTCVSKVQQLLMLGDTSVADEVTTCIDSWNPAPGANACINLALPFKLPSFVDPIKALKQIVGEIKDGCDPVIPVVECRGELKPLAPLTMAGPGPRPPSPTVIRGAFQGLVNCVSKGLKNSPCKTLATVLNAVKADIVNALVSLVPMPRGPPGSSGPSTYDRYCNTGNPKFARFAEFLEEMH